MSKKDYVKFADMFKENLAKYEGKVMSQPLLDCVFQSAKIFHYDNPAFRPYQYFQACGLDKETSAIYEARI